MSEWRTQAQVDADQKLHAAIVDVLAAYSDDPAEGQKFMLTEYVVVTVRSGISDDRAGHVTYDYQLSNGSVPWHNMIGMMHWARLAMEQSMRDKRVDGDTDED